MRLASLTFLFLLVLSHSLFAQEKPARPAEKEEGLTKSEKQVIELTNEQRKLAGLPALRVNAKLVKAARNHSANMASRGRMAHVLDGKAPPDRLKDVEYAHRGCGENCAAGQRTGSEAVEAWMRSPGHKANILSDRYTEIGVGVARAEDGTRYWTQVFAAPAE